MVVVIVVMQLMQMMIVMMPMRTDAIRLHRLQMMIIAVNCRDCILIVGSIGCWMLCRRVNGAAAVIRSCRRIRWATTGAESHMNIMLSGRNGMRVRRRRIRCVRGGRPRRQTDVLLR